MDRKEREKGRQTSLIFFSPPSSSSFLFLLLPSHHRQTYTTGVYDDDDTHQGWINDGDRFVGSMTRKQCSVRRARGDGLIWLISMIHWFYHAVEVNTSFFPQDYRETLAHTLCCCIDFDEPSLQKDTNTRIRGIGNSHGPCLMMCLCLWYSALLYSFFLSRSQPLGW